MYWECNFGEASYLLIRIPCSLAISHLSLTIGDGIMSERWPGLCTEQAWTWPNTTLQMGLTLLGVELSIEFLSMCVCCTGCHHALSELRTSRCCVLLSCYCGCCCCVTHHTRHVQMLQIAEAFTFLHTRNPPVVHRCVKCAYNMFYICACVGPKCIPYQIHG